MAEDTRSTKCMAHLINPTWQCKDLPMSAQTGNELRIRLCEYHMWQIGRHSKKIQASIERLAKKRRQPVRRRHVRISQERELESILAERDKTIADLQQTIRELHEKPTSRTPIIDGTVYFLRIGGYIKIGWTSDLDRRMKAYPPDTTLLATMPGTRKDELREHKRFAHLRTHGREWYPLAPQITERVDVLVRKHGEPAQVTFAAKPVIPAGSNTKQHLRPKNWR